MKKVIRWECCNPAMGPSCLGYEESSQLGEDGNPKPLRSTPVDGGPKCPYENKCSECNYGMKKELTIWPMSYDNEKEDYDYKTDYDNFMKEMPGEFHVAGFDNGKSADKIVCKRCGGNNFELGNGEYSIVIKCPVCNWEYEFECD